jgi:small GTP-binding protein
MAQLPTPMPVRLPPPTAPERGQPADVPSAAERCALLLEPWRAELRLSERERAGLAPELRALDQQLQALAERRLRVAVFGRVGVGKSSLLNALLGQNVFATDVAHGCTRSQQRVDWPVAVPGLAAVELVDTPGIDEIAAHARQRLAARVALGADLVLLVLDGDLTSPEAEGLEVLLAAGKPVLVVLNRCDCWPAAELEPLLASIRRRLPAAARPLQLLAVASAPRRAVLLEDGRVRSEAEAPRIAPLRQALLHLLAEHGALLLGLNGLRAADRFAQRLHRWRLQRGRSAAQALIGRYAALKATGVAANPLLLLDLAGGLALDAALVTQLCQLYGLELGSGGARALLARLSTQNALLGGTQLGIQLLLGGLRQVLLLAAPLSGGLSLAPAAPVAVAQAALAVHTTRLTGRLAAAELLRGAERGRLRPASLLRRLARQDPQVRAWLQQWQPQADSGARLQALLP